MRTTLFFSIFLLPILAFGQLKVGEQPPIVTLSEALGGKVDGSGKWSSSDITGKVFTLMYVDPDEKEINEHVETALKAENFDRSKYGSIAVINMDATWKPNYVVKKVLEGKQKDFPHTIYVMDMKKELVKKWKLADDNYNVLTFDKNGKLLFFKSGKLTPSDVEQLIKTIKDNI